MEQEEILKSLIGQERYHYFLTLKKMIEASYDCSQTWKEQKVKTKKWKYEWKFSKGSKTLCGFYFADFCFGLMVILGKEERNRVESHRQEFSEAFWHLYEETPTYHDGKWLMMEINDLTLQSDIRTLLLIKRKSDREL